MEGLQTKLEQAYEEYKKRQSRESHPDGRTDQGGRWYPSDEERRPCCDKVRSPSRQWPWSLMTHCRTLGHVARLHGVDEGLLRSMNNAARKPPSREGGDHYYKAVKVYCDGTMFSLYKTKFEYEIGKMLEQVPRQGHNGGIYVYDNPENARELAEGYYNLLPVQYVILRCLCEGRYCVYEGGGIRKLAFERVTPLEIVES